MKKTIFAFLVLSALVKADDFTLTDGTTYTNATVRRVEPDGLVVADADGIRKLKFSNLSPQIQQKYGFDSVKANQFSNQVIASSVAAQKEMEKMVDAQNAQSEKLNAQIEKLSAQSASPATSSTKNTPDSQPTVYHPHKAVSGFESHIHGCGGNYIVLSCDETGLTCRHSEFYKTRTENKEYAKTEHIPYYYLPPKVRAACGFPPPSISDPM
jgi:hypothetical protein